MVQGSRFCRCSVFYQNTSLGGGVIIVQRQLTLQSRSSNMQCICKVKVKGASLDQNQEIVKTLLKELNEKKRSVTDVQYLADKMKSQLAFKLTATPAHPPLHP